eukprot:TRINITY_DN5390_c0_g1_i1.p1 TRINITY_DN5390_c0_g1~~TRINITY_DN5390_c0_g1_i1.p1  ORF type:complete len:739 (-),score=161.33 TRINITY_DN5390_c0_g1_i1:13-2229(-)
MSDTSKELQLIDFDGEFIAPLKQQLTDWDIIQNGYNYSVLSIIGCQSSGKSTLLNHLFHTNFQVMNSNVGRLQTTKGIWLGVTNLPSYPFLIFDIEGTDARERRDLNTHFEKKSSLFALALSDILLINLWIHDIGRDQASYFHLFLIVFEINMHLFVHSSGSHPKTLLLFVLRDYDEMTPVERLMDVVFDDMNQVWNSIHKPDAYKDCKLSDFFTIEYFALPHIRNPEFSSRVDSLRERFLNQESPDYIIRDQFKKGIPIDGLPFHCESIWETIRTNRDLDLPSQKHLLAMYRCDELMKQQFQNFESQIIEFSEEIHNTYIDNFKSVCKTLIDSAIEDYTTSAIRYESSVFEEYKDKLLQVIDNTLNPLFKKQLNHVFVRMKKNSTKRVNELKDEFQLNLKDICDQLKSEYLTEFTETANKNLIFDDWHFNDEMENIEEFLDEQMRGLYIHQYSLFTQIYTGKFTKVIKRDITFAKENNILNFWESITPRYRANLSLQAKDFMDDYSATFGDNTWIQNIEDPELLYKRTFKNIISADTQNILSLMTRIFQTSFKFEDGIPRDFKSKSVLKNTWKECRQNTEKIIDIFSVVRLDEEYGDFSYFRSIEDLDMQDEIDIPDSLVIIEPDECISLIHSFRETALESYFEAKLKHDTVDSKAKSDGIPKVFYLLFFLFALDEIVWMAGYIMSSPTFIMLILCLAGTYYIIKRLKLMPFITPVLMKLKPAFWSQIEEQIEKFLK